MSIKDNPHIQTFDRDFFILLRIGLWQEVKDELSANPDWEQIYRLATEQTVHGIIADGIGLYAEEHPEMMINWDRYDEYLVNVGHTVRQNWNINVNQSRVCQLLTSHNIKYVVLKGQGVAQYYPKPMLRCSGDIDLLLKKSDFNTAKNLLATIATGDIEEQKDQMHASAMIGETEVELHAEEFKTLGRANVRRYTELKERMLGEEDKLRTYMCNEVEVSLAPATFDAFYIFLHFVKHYYHEGLGLRQLTDWTMFLTHNAKEIEVALLTEYLNEFGMTAEWNTFLHFVCTYLNLPESIAVQLRIASWKETGNKADKICERIWETCKQTGNFGHKELESNKPLNRLQGYWRDVTNAHIRARKKWALSPTLAISQLAGFYGYYIKLAFMKMTKQKHQ